MSVLFVTGKAFEGDNFWEQWLPAMGCLLGVFGFLRISIRSGMQKQMATNSFMFQPMRYNISATHFAVRSANLTYHCALTDLYQIVESKADFRFYQSMCGAYLIPKRVLSPEEITFLKGLCRGRQIHKSHL